MGHQYLNGFMALVLLTLLTTLVLLIGYGLGGGVGLVIAIAVSAAMNGFAYFYSDIITLRALRARPVLSPEAPQLYAILDELVSEQKQPAPRLYISPFAQPNACATGRNPRHAAICLTEGILSLLTPRELRAVIGHELSHIYNRDILIGSIAATLAGIITSLAYLALLFPVPTNDEEEDSIGALSLLLMLVLGPVAATIIQLAVTHNREYQADESGAYLTGDPSALAHALRKIHRGTRQLPFHTKGPIVGSAHLMIANPLSEGGIAGLFSTHPPMARRIAKLNQLAHMRGFRSPT